MLGAGAADVVGAARFVFLLDAGVTGVFGAARLGPPPAPMRFMGLAPVCARANTIVRGSDGRNDVEGDTAALSCNVERLRRLCLHGVVAQVYPFAFSLPFRIALHPAYTAKLRGAGFSVLYMIDAVFEVVVVCARRSLLRRMESKVLPRVFRLPCFYP